MRRAITRKHGALLRVLPYVVMLELLAPQLALAHPHESTPRTPCAATPSSQDTPIDLNAATAAMLVKLPGIGPARARAIIELRQRIGRFRRVSQLLRVRGIGRATLRRLIPHLLIAPRDARKSQND